MFKHSKFDKKGAISQVERKHFTVVSGYIIINDLAISLHGALHVLGNSQTN